MGTDSFYTEAICDLNMQKDLAITNVGVNQQGLSIKLITNKGSNVLFEPYN